MPGIIGTIGNDRLLQPSQLEAMIQSMMHEPFYKSGSLTFNKLNFEAGWICDEGSFSDCMPIWNDHRNICLIFWGEHFSDGKNRDAAFLVRLYEEHQMKFFQMLNGIFNGILIDFRENKIVLFNDRYGLARVYYHESASGFYFASEAKALFKVLPQLRILDMRSLGEFFSCGCALQNRSLFQGISLLPPGSMWTFRAGRPVEKQAYFEKESWESLPSLSPEAYYQQLKESFIRILPRYFSQKQPVAL
jgi:asparagine synthase (glutamine-hydrolysing)